MESIEASRLWITCASLVVSIFALIILVLILIMLKQALEKPLSTTPSACSAEPPGGAAGLVAAKKTIASLKPGRSCGHCGVRTKGDPVRGIAFDEKSYLVYACSECRKETLLPQ